MNSGGRIVEALDQGSWRAPRDAGSVAKTVPDDAGGQARSEYPKVFVMQAGQDRPGRLEMGARSRPAWPKQGSDFNLRWPCNDDGHQPDALDRKTSTEA